MCAIVGMFCNDGSVDRAVLSRMRDAMTHRGPDDAGLFISNDGKVGLGHRRLSIIDLSPNGHQPMSNEDGSVWLVFNGEIYNFRELRQQLQAAGHLFRSDSDSEVIVHAYEQWGDESVKRFRGMFAFVLWDEKRQRLLLARDRLGIKPLFYREDEGSLIFASELKAIRANPALTLQVDPTAIYDFFTYGYVPTPKSIYRGVYKLPPGNLAVYEAGRLTLRQYWDATFGGASACSESEASDIVRKKLVETVGLHLIADVPVGVMLSGGVDSSAVCSLAASEISGPLHSFSIGFDVAKHSETHFARMVADRYATEHHELTVTHPMATVLRKRVVEMYDEPFADGSAIPTFYVSQLARRDVKVALSGEGGDELFGGYTWYSDWLRLRWVDGLPRSLWRALDQSASWLPDGTKGKWSLNMAALNPIERYAKMMSGLLKEEKRELLAPRFVEQFDGYDDYWHLRRFWREDLDPLSRLQYLDIKTYLNDDILTKVDRASMAVSLEARVPLLDHELIETVLALPVAIRNRAHQPKYLFKRLLENLLPQEILQRQKKGFSVPFYEWLKVPAWSDFEPLFDYRFIHPEAIKRDGVHGATLWPFVVMGQWLTDHA
jgi:asparagine synthase (glutamine-hydrolysing)